MDPYEVVESSFLCLNICFYYLAYAAVFVNE